MTHSITLKFTLALLSLPLPTPYLISPHLISPTHTPRTYVPYPLQVSLQLSKYVAEYLQLTPGTWSGRKAPIQYLSKQESWQLLNEEHCFQVCVVGCSGMDSIRFYWIVLYLNFIPISVSYSYTITYSFLVFTTILPHLIFFLHVILFHISGSI